MIRKKHKPKLRISHTAYPLGEHNWNRTPGSNGDNYDSAFQFDFRLWRRWIRLELTSTQIKNIHYELGGKFSVSLCQKGGI